MFGLIVSNRLVDTSFRQVDQTHCVIDISDGLNFNHIVVFLTGKQPFPDETGGAVYFSWPNSDGWQYLGQLSNAKPSAIFKVGKFKNQAMDEQNLSARFGQQMIQSHQPVNQPVAQVGISVEPINVLQGLQLGMIEEDKELVPKFVDFTQKMVQSLFNYTASFAIDAAEATTRSSETYIPYSAVREWSMNFERRIANDPYFWKKP